MSFRHEARRPEETLIVVADRGTARMFSAPWPLLEPCKEVDGFVHPESRLRERDTVSDGPGRIRTPRGQAAVTEGATDFRHRTAERFAHELIERLEAGRNRQEFGRLVLVAPALFLGELRRELPTELSRMTVAEIDKDLVQAPVAVIVDQVRQATASGRAAVATN